MSFATAVHRIVNEIGESVTYRRISGSVYNNETGENTPTTTDTTIKAHCKEYRPQEINGDIQAGDRRVIIGSDDLSFVPQKGDQVRIDSIWFEVKAVNRLTVHDTEAMYRLRVRQ